MDTQLDGRTLYIPHMCKGSAILFAKTFESIGVDAKPLPDSTDETIRIGLKHTSGDECYPQQVVLGSFLSLVERENFDPQKVALFLPTASGPCRFGQYANLTRKILKSLSLSEIKVISPTSENSYEGVGKMSQEFQKCAFIALVLGDLLRRLLFRIRPYEVTKGETERAYNRSTTILGDILARSNITYKERFKKIKESLFTVRKLFRQIEQDRTEKKLLIGIVGEIYCRLDEFANGYTARKIEELGGEVWLSDVSEWLFYTSITQADRAIQEQRYLSYFGVKIKNFVQKWIEHKLLDIFENDLKDRKEPDVRKLLNYSHPYLPYKGALGEMVLSVGKAVYLYHAGAHGVIDISPFSCMNGIVTESVYPKVRRDHDNFPIKNLYYDSTKKDLYRDLEIFMELAREYRNTLDKLD